MEHFFVDEDFFDSIEDFMHDRQLENTEEVKELKDDWEEKIEFAELEKVIEIDDSLIEDIFEWLMDRNEERFPEHSETTEAKIKNALKESINIKKMKKLMPELWYPNQEHGKITKQDLLDAL